MAPLDELQWLDATAQAELVRRGDVHPRELVAAALRRIEALNPALNAVVWRRAEEALAEAGRVDRSLPFAGVPMLLKDLMGEMAGTRNSAGCRLLKDNVCGYDSELAARLRASGALVVGRANSPEFGLVPTTEPLLHGPARNPWDTARSPGGSSGGSAAAVASGMVPAAHGNDGGGSIRIPSSCCGVFGLKPSRGRTSLGPARGDVLLGLVSEHVITRSVRDSAALLDALAGPAPGDPYAAPAMEGSFLAAAAATRRPLRLALQDASPYGGPVHPECAAAVRCAAEALESLGHEVVEHRLPLDGEEVVTAFTVLWLSSAAEAVEGLCFAAGVPAAEPFFEPLTLVLAELGNRYSARELLRAHASLQRAARGVARSLAGFDAWLTPTLAQLPPPLGAFLPDPAAPTKDALLKGFHFTPFTQVANFAGLPAFSAPTHWSAEGLPVGVHAMGHYGSEGTLLRLAAELEEALPWFQRRPPEPGVPNL
ncbi:MAG: amidase [Candidatus Sumerlaeia bacterium]|nr:amidase [Candidatus Sumerlaeia bacterium]